MKRVGTDLRMMMLTAFALSAHAAAQAREPTRASAERAADDQDRIICKKFAVTGSLLATYKECKKKRDWERERNNIRSPSTTSGSCASAESGSCTGTSVQ